MVEPRETTSPVRDCILFSTADWDEPYWTNKQHTTRIFAQQGWRVLYVESVGFRAPKIGSGRDWSRLWRRLKTGLRSLILGAPRRDANIWVLSPLMVPAKHHWPLVRGLNKAMLRASVSRFAKVHDFVAPVIWTYHPFMMDAISKLAHGPLVYHCVDDLTAIPGVDVAAFLAAERALLQRCTAVFTTSTALRDRCLHITPNTHYFGNVVDAAHFGQAMIPGPLPFELATIPEPRLVYHGVLSDFKVNFPLLLEAARAQPDWQWIIIGEEREGQRSAIVPELARLPNVHFLGYKTYAQLPHYLRGMQVGLLPTLLNDYTRSMFPMKFYEYLAAGLPVVSTPLDFTRESLACLEVGATPQAFVTAIARQIARGRLTSSQACDAVGDNTWERRLEKMLAIALAGNGAAS